MFNLNGKILTYKIGEYPILEKYCKGLKLEFIKRSKRFFHFFKICERNVLKYLITNVKKIDFLNLIHFSYENAIYGVLYKLLKKNGFIYLKMDVDESIKNIDLFRWYRSRETHYKGILDFLNFQFKKKIYSTFLDKLDLISVESISLYNYLKKRYPKLRNRLIYLPNGIDDIYITEAGILRTSFSEKQNIILSVGRIGIKVKSNETLLEAVSKIKDLKDWKIIFIGPIEKRFFKYIEDFFKNFPLLKERIHFMEEITDRKRLFEYYQKSKIFCLTSKSESFGIVLVEAGYFGNFIICSNFPAAKDITRNESLGTLFNPGDSEKLAEILQELINNEEPLKENSLKIQKHVENNYKWSKIILKLYGEILKRRKK